MSTDGIQITIPDFDDEDYRSTPIFGRTPGASLWGTPSSGQDSPTILTPVALPERADRSYFHSRADSITSDDSTHSLQYPTRKVKSPFVHSAQSSFAANAASSSFTKKSSFASLRNAFKKASEPAPPVPALDQQPYPALKNPFNRSTSSLAQLPPMPHRHQPSMQASPPNFRPSTPGSADFRGRSMPSRMKEHKYGRSQHSHSSSAFHSSDGGSDAGYHMTSSSPPPVPRMPHGFGGITHRDESRSLSDLEDKINMEPRTPSDYALHAIFIRFAASAEMRIDEFLRQPLEREPALSVLIGPGVDSKLDELLLSLGKIAQKHGKQVIDSIIRWRKLQNESMSTEMQQYHLLQATTSARGARPQDILSILNERKSLASIYIMCRALIAATENATKDGLNDSTGHSLEELTFEQFKKPDIKLLTASANHRSNAELYAILLGQLAKVRFESVTDRFLVELGPVAAGQVPKDADLKYENLVKGLKYVPITVWPPESFEEGAEFMASLSKSFENAHGHRLKTIFAETLVHMLHPIAKTAQAEVNHPEWAKAIEVIFPKARDMMAKPRYWHVAFPLAVTALCVAPQEYFLRNWNVCFEAGLSKIKERIHRLPVLNGLLRLMWTYLYRCHEPASTATARAESALKHFFPANKLTVSPQDEHLEPFIYLLHFVLSRHFDVGSEFCLELLQERSVTGHPSNLSNVLAPERITVATQAILLSLHAIEREEPTPAWPTSCEFSILPDREDYPTSSKPIPASVLSKGGWKDFIDRSSLCLTTFGLYCYQTVGKWSILDEQWSVTRITPNYEDAHNFVIRSHAEFSSVAYPNQFASHIHVLQVVYQSWPRCLHSSLAIEDAFDMLIRGILHVEPAIGEAANHALQRFVMDGLYVSVLLSRLSNFLFDPASIAGEGSGLKLNIESPRLLALWLTFIDQWINEIKQKPPRELTAEEMDDIKARAVEIEAGALFLLAYHKLPAYHFGCKAMRLLAGLHSHLQLPTSSLDLADAPFQFAAALNGKLDPKLYLHGHEDILEADELVRLEHWKQDRRQDVALQLAGSDILVDRNLWRHIFPALLQVSMRESCNSVLLNFREKVVAAANRFHQFVVHLAGVSNRTPSNLPQRSGSVGEKDMSRLVNDHRPTIQQWHAWIKIICATAQVSDNRPAANHSKRDHSRGWSEVNAENEQMANTRDLFKYLSQFLDSDHTLFRDVAVSSISFFPASGYSQLLEDLSILASRQFYDDTRSKAANVPVVGRARRQERFHTAVARIYYLTAHMLEDQRSSGKQTALTHVLKYVRNMQAFLLAPEHRDLFSLQRLRRYFCGTVQRLFDGLATLNDSDRFIPPNTYLALYRLCEEWCQFGKQSENVTRRLIIMQTAAGKSLTDPADQAEIIQRFQTETKALSYAAVGAMAALCHKAYFPPDQSSGSPTDRTMLDTISKPLQATQTLDRITAILANFHEPVQSAGKKALRSLLVHSHSDNELLDEVLRRAFVTTRELDTSNARFFEVVAQVIWISPPVHGFTFSQAVCLGLSNLCHPLQEIRRQAFNVLEAIHEQSCGLISLMQYEAAVCSSAPSAYLHAHRLISDVLAGEHPDEAVNVLAQLADWIPRAFDSTSDKGSLLLLQSLEYWIPSMNLMDSTNSALSREGRLAIYHLMALTLRYAESYAEQVLVLWTRLVDAPHQANGYAVIKFLLEQSPKVGSTVFISCAAKVVACLSQSAVSNLVFEELCGLLDPSRMLPTYEHKMSPPDAEELEEWSDLDILFSEQPKLTLGQTQFALLFLSEAATERYWGYDEQMPVLLHALFMHLNYRHPFIQQRSRHMLFQLLRSCMSGYDEMMDRSLYRSRSGLRSAIRQLEQQADMRVWKEEESRSQAESKLRWLSAEVLDLLEPLYPRLRSHWGSWALRWGTACLKRDLAYQSLQLYRVLNPPVSAQDIDMVLGRLASTVADEDPSIQKFTVELILTLTAMASSDDLDAALLPKLYWGAVACLSTTVENEFLHVVELLDTLLSRLDLDDPQVVDALLERKPLAWDGSLSLQSRLLIGLRSSTTSALTLKLLQRLAGVGDGRLIDSSDGRVRDLYTLALPLCLHAMTNGSQDQTLQSFALDIGRLADEEERPSIHRIMTSFAKSRFRTKEDFLRESVTSLREHYGSEHWTEIITLLMSLVLNKEQWLRSNTMKILKLLFQQRETRSPVNLLGSELLMPLLRLLETDLASEALDVLDEPLQISGGPAAKHVLRMSLYHHLRADAKEVDSVAEVFGVAQESGWCVPRPSSLRDACRSNLYAVFDSSKHGRPSRIEFSPEQIQALQDGSLDDDLGDMVQNLHELSAFFREGHSPGPVANRQLEARIAAILAKSSQDIPPTPFADAFDVESEVGSSTSYEDSDDSDYDTSSDLFEFDSPAMSRYTSNSSH